MAVNIESSKQFLFKKEKIMNYNEYFEKMKKIADMQKASNNEEEIIELTKCAIGLGFQVNNFDYLHKFVTKCESSRYEWVGYNGWMCGVIRFTNEEGKKGCTAWVEDVEGKRYEYTINHLTSTNTIGTAITHILYKSGLGNEICK